MYDIYCISKARRHLFPPSILSSREDPIFKQQKLGHGSRQSPKPKAALLAKINRNWLFLSLDLGISTASMPLGNLMPWHKSIYLAFLKPSYRDMAENTRKMPHILRFLKYHFNKSKDNKLILYIS
jgi:hypothetical protein